MQGRLDSVAAGAGTNAVSWSELRRALKLRKYLRRRYFLHNKTAQRSIKLLHSNVFYVQGHSRLTAERHRSAMLLRRSDSLRLETCPGLRSKSRKVPCESHRTLVRCHFARRADGDPLGKTDSKQAVACWSVSVGGVLFDLDETYCEICVRSTPGLSQKAIEKTQGCRKRMPAAGIRTAT